MLQGAFSNTVTALTNAKIGYVEWGQKVMKLALLLSKFSKTCTCMAT